jgi:sugar lactone lactonase YvrE
MPRPGTEGRLAGDGRVAVTDAVRVLSFVSGFLPYRRLAPEPMVSTVAGSGKPRLSGGDFLDGPSAHARFRSPWALCIAPNGAIYVADSYNNRIRKIENGIVTTVAGHGPSGGRGGWVDGPVEEAEFLHPRDVECDAHGNLFVADMNHAVRKITPDGWVFTVAGSGTAGYRDGQGTEAQFAYPNALTALPNGDILVADSGNDCIRRITPDGRVTTWTGSPDRPGLRDGPADQAEFDEPDGIGYDAAGNVYVADGKNNAVRRIAPNGFVMTLAGDGTPGNDDGCGPNARFVVPMSIDVDSQGNIYTADFVAETIRKITPDGEVTTLAGNAGRYGLKDGPASEARFFSPMGLACAPDGRVYVADTDNSRIRIIRQK